MNIKRLSHFCFSDRIIYARHELQELDTKNPSFETWLELERRSLQEAYSFAVLQYASYLEQKQRFTEVTTLLYRTLQENILNEELVQVYMRCAHLAGKRQKALEIFERFKQELKKELEIAPLVSTLSLAETIRQNNN